MVYKVNVSNDFYKRKMRFILSRVKDPCLIWYTFYHEKKNLVLGFEIKLIWGVIGQLCINFLCLVYIHTYLHIYIYIYWPTNLGEFS